MPRPTAFLFVFALSLPGASAPAAVRNVPTDYATIQAAIEASSFGDVVEVAPGTYLEHLTISSPQDGVRLRGTLGASATTLDGGGSGTVLTASDVGAVTSIEGFTIRNGFDSYAGGGLHLLGAAISVVDCVIEDNSATAAGGAYLDGASTPTFTRCIIRNNRAPGGSGGGVYADHGGGGTFRYCVIYGNTCAAFGGGVTAWERAHPVLEHCTISGNGAAMAGGNVFFTRSGGFSVSNCIASSPTQGANVEAQSSPGDASFTCCDLFALPGNNVVGFASPVGSNGTLSADPLFCNAPVGDFGLFAGSPCAPAQAGACQLIGAGAVQCGAVPTVHLSWGSLKSRYR